MRLSLAKVCVGIVFVTTIISVIAYCSAVAAQAAVNAWELVLNQKARDLAFRNLKAATTEYTFDYVVIQVPPGSIPGVDAAVPVSHIRFKSTVFFAFDKAAIEPSAEKPILELAKVVLADKSAASLLIVGHTDAVGTEQYNSSLSLNRAVEVARKLRDAGLSDKMLGVVPMGEAQPISTNRTSEGKAQNRRVEFFISEVPGATRKAIERINFNPCHRNDQEIPAGQLNPECTNADVRIPVYAGTSGRSQTEFIDLSRAALRTPSIPLSRPRLPSEVLERPSLKELQ